MHCMVVIFHFNMKVVLTVSHASTLPTATTAARTTTILLSHFWSILKPIVVLLREGRAQFYICPHVVLLMLLVSDV